jgi:hypothetical protein
LVALSACIVAVLNPNIARWSRHRLTLIGVGTHQQQSMRQRPIVLKGMSTRLRTLTFIRILGPVKPVGAWDTGAGIMGEIPW